MVSLQVWVIFLIVFGGGNVLSMGLYWGLHGALNVHQVGLSFFGFLNTIICFWEICLLLHRKGVRDHFLQLSNSYKGREMNAVLEWFRRRVSFSDVAKTSFWCDVWSYYALFDPSYSNQESFGFFIDVGNGISTFLPSLYITFCMGLELLSARVFGVMTLLVLFQMAYGTFLYFGSYLLNRRYLGHTKFDVFFMVLMTNIVWVVFPFWGFWVAWQLIDTNTYAVLH